LVSRQIGDLELRLTYFGYDVPSIADDFTIKPADVRFQERLGPLRTRAPTEQMIVADLPV
jgi:hypothetical protein